MFRYPPRCYRHFPIVFLHVHIVQGPEDSLEVPDEVLRDSFGGVELEEVDKDISFDQVVCLFA